MKVYYAKLKGKEGWFEIIVGVGGEVVTENHSFEDVSVHSWRSMFIFHSYCS
jgi:hypothetical protein